ncbi:hypothetical protein LI90_3466 [Carbonactinospora thermoautotrophica]|uniref:Uncharacterized protein n=1 Tax=Carbonactinospora thermoautotrophica TaxID=1469144 RepID=A0A132MX55_9ACTN|nr:hypothetical protein LI90_3466 [Carbonactinospora thermoautotrophica]
MARGPARPGIREGPGRDLPAGAREPPAQSVLRNHLSGSLIEQRFRNTL